MLFGNFFFGVYFKDLSVLWGGPNHHKPWEFTSLQLLPLPSSAAWSKIIVCFCKQPPVQMEPD